MPEIDLHTHSTASDGTLSPAQLVATAQAMGLQALALTDHDTVQGLPEACAAGRKHGLEVIGGCELSVSYADKSMHILGLWVPQSPPILSEALQHLHTLRAERNKTIIHNLQTCGVPITYEELEKEAQGATIGRPHIAKLLVDKNRATNIQDAFTNWLVPGTKGFAPKKKFSARKAIELLKSVQATVILAHPCSLKTEGKALEAVVRELKSFGLDGVEVYYSMHSQAQTMAYAELCRKLDLLQSAGSDFHGSNKPHIALGRGKGGLRSSYMLVEKMKEHRDAQGLKFPECSYHGIKV